MKRKYHAKRKREEIGIRGTFKLRQRHACASSAGKAMIKRWKKKDDDDDDVTDHTGPRLK